MGHATDDSGERVHAQVYVRSAEMRHPCEQSTSKDIPHPPSNVALVCTDLASVPLCWL